MYNTDNLRIKELKSLVLPSLLAEQLPLTNSVASLVKQARHQASEIIHGRDDRLLLIVGPCSIHDPNAAIEYAKQLKKIADKYKKELCIIMRVYFEKPRTTVGWKGLINDPYLNGSFKINKGLHTARKLLLDINEIGLPTGSEFLDTIIPQYISDLISWSAIGARTAESQIHRELASGLSMPIGFKNGTAGDIQIAVDAVLAAQHPHHFLGVSKDGIASIVSTTGNEDCHIILRGSREHTNYDAESIAEAVSILSSANLESRVMVDCSHGNSAKNHLKQKDVAADLCKQINMDSHSIMGIMIESNLVAGKQSITPNEPLTYGQSITDACINLEDTEIILSFLAEAVNTRRALEK